MIIFKRHWGIILLLVLSVWAIKPFFIPGFFPMHDDTQVVRVSQMAQALTDGQFPVRWVKDLGYGYGYPLFNFYAPLPYYVGGLLSIGGINALDSTKAMMVIGILLSGLFMYFLAREFWGEIGGIISGLFYTYAPYHAVDVYVRGAVGEFWAYAFLPLFFYGLWKVYQKQKWQWVGLGGVGFAGVILSHNLTALMLLPFFAIVALFYCYIAIKKRKIFIIYHLSFIILLGLGLSAFYWLPALWEIGYANIFSQIGGGADFRDHFVCWQQLWDSPWGFGGSIPGCLDGLSFKIGKLHIITPFIVAITLLFPVFIKKHFNLIIGLAFLGFLISILLMLAISEPLWEKVTPMAFLQYPWRFLIFSSFFSSLVVGATMRLARHYLSAALYFGGGALLIVLLLYFNLKLFNPQTIFPKTVNDYVNEDNIKWTTSKISDEYMPKNFQKPKAVNEVARTRISGGEIVKNKTQELTFIIDNDKEKNILINIAPFPAWQAYIDGIAASYKNKDNGMELSIAAGEHQVGLVFISTPVEKIANILSLISIAMILMLYLKSLKYAKAHS